MSLIRLFRRAFVSNLSVLSSSDAERDTLTRVGIQDARVQGYFTWRRSLVATVVLVTVASTALATYRELTESDDQPSLFDNVTAKLQEAAEDTLTDEVETEIETSADAVQGVRDRIVKSAALDAISAHADEQAEEPIPTKLSAFGRFADFVELAALYALSAASLIALLTWTRFRASYRVLQAGFFLSFFAPLIIALCPWSWWGYDDVSVNYREDPAAFLQQMLEGLVEAAGYLITLLPTVLSLIPGVQRACLRIKTLLPEAMLPGWYLVAAAPLYGLFLLVIFVGINQVASDPVFLLGVFLFLAAPALYVIQADVFTRPLATEADFQQMRSVQRLISGITVIAGLLLLYYVSTQDVLGIRAVGLNPETSLLQPLDLVEFLLEFLGRSLFMTVFGADLFLMMTLSSWRHQQAFAGSPGENNYNRVMSGLAAAIEQNSSNYPQPV